MEIKIKHTRSDIDAMRRCILRETRRRELQYPDFVKDGKMSQLKADFELKDMKAVLDFFNLLQIYLPPEQGRLF